MNQDLFRPQVLAWQLQGQHGRLVLSCPPGARLISMLVCALTCLSLLFLSFNTYTRKVTVNGSLVPDLGLVIMKAPASGTVAGLQVNEGEQVQQGDTLYMVNKDPGIEGGGLMGESLLGKLAEQRAAIAARLAILHERWKLLESEGEQQRRQLQDELAGIEQMLVQEQLVLDITHKAHNRLLRLQHSAGVAAADLDTALLQVLQQEKTLTGLQQKKQQAESRLSALQFEYGRRQLELEQQIAVSNEETLRLDLQEVQMLAERSMEVRSPVTGRIGNLDLFDGKSIVAGEPLLSVVPAQSSLLAELLIPSTAVGLLEQGQRINLHLDSFPYQKFGIQQGRVLSVDSAASQVPARPGQQSQSVFRLLAELDSQSVNAFGMDYSLHAGMLLSAEIVLEERTLLEWLCEPLFSAAVFAR